MTDLILDKTSKVKLYLQLHDAIVQKINDGSYKPGQKLPSVRTISSDLKLSRNTVTAAYDLLKENGFVKSVTKSGYIITGQNESVPKESVPVKSPKISKNKGILTVDDILNQPENSTKSAPPQDSESITIPVPENLAQAIEDLKKVETIVEKDEISDKDSNVFKSPEIFFSTNKDQFPFYEFSKCLQSIQSKFLNIKNVIPEAFGQKNLRRAISNFLSIKKKANCTASQIIVNAGLDELFYNTLKMINRPLVQVSGKGLLNAAKIASTVGLTKKTPVLAMTTATIQNLSHLADIIRSAGILTCAINSDPETDLINIKDLENCNADYILVTSPFKGVNATETMRALIEWAAAKPDRIIIEIDTNFCNGQPTLQSFDNHSNTIYFGNISNLSPCINTNFAILPPQIAAKYRELYTSRIHVPSILEQLILTEYLQDWNSK